MRAVLIGGPADSLILEIDDEKMYHNVVTPSRAEGYVPGRSGRDGSRRPMLTKVYHYVRKHVVAGVAIMELQE